MKFLYRLYPVTFLFLILLSSACAVAPSTDSTITIDSSVRHQTMVGWEATGLGDVDDPLFDTYRDALFDKAINELGINRIRLEACRPCFGVTRGTGFDLAAVDANIEKGILPYRQAVEAAGGKLLVNLTVVGNGYANDPEGYAQAALALMQHVQSKYGFVPDYWEIALEPDNFGWGNPTNVANALMATAPLFKANGFTPKFIVPSNTNMSNAISWFDTIIQTPGAQEYVDELSYHRYSGVSAANVRELANRGAQYGINTAMLEHIWGNYDELHQDLTVGNNAVWQQYTMSWRDKNDDGTKYLLIDRDNPGAPDAVSLSSTSKFLRQYFKFIRPGAVRIGAVTGNGTFDPVAFVNPDGSQVVVVKASSGGTFSVVGLPAGAYSINFTTDAQFDTALSDITLANGQKLETTIPAKGVITIYTKPGTASSSGTPPAPP